MGQSRPLFLFIFVFSTRINLNSNLNWKSIDGVLGIQTRGGRMEGTDESTAAPHSYYILLLRLPQSFVTYSLSRGSVPCANFTQHQYLNWTQWWNKCLRTKVCKLGARELCYVTPYTGKSENYIWIKRCTLTFTDWIVLRPFWASFTDKNSVAIATSKKLLLWFYITRLLTTFNW